MIPLRNLIGGQWVDRHPLETLDIVDPASEQTIALLPLSTPAEIDAAVESASEASRAWSAMSVHDRVDALLRVADVLERHVAELAQLEERDMGRPAAAGEQWIRGAIAGFRRDVRLALRYRFTRVSDDPSTTVVRRPLGVAAVIIPWNFPINTMLTSLGALLAAGNTVVFKPSEKASLSTVRVAELMELPAGVVNVILGDGRAGTAVSEHPKVELTYFTGSVRSGIAVATAGAQRLHRVILELGGKDPVIVDSGVDVAAAARDVARGAFTNTGQICTSMERIYVHQDVATEFVDELTAEASRYGPSGSSSQVQIGPMVDRAQRDIVAAHVEDAVAHGAVVRVGGTVPQGPGYWYPATVLTDVTDEMTVMSEETFGPLAPVQVVADFAEGVARATVSSYGLAATVYTEDPDHIALAVKQLAAAIVWVNKWQGASSEAVYEPAGASGMTAVGHFASYDAATRPTSIVSTTPACPPLTDQGATMPAVDLQ
ncbi:MAG: aldehyde dehydrogenase [Comamonadaceae bacterium]|nr:MAG: aldehyde dehydrogenase [Comamonadaceae bacterium]